MMSIGNNSGKKISGSLVTKLTFNADQCNYTLFKFQYVFNMIKPIE